MGKNQTTVKNFTTKYFILICVAMIVATVFIGVTLTIKSANFLKELTRNNMASLSDTASIVLDGDEIKTLTAEDAPLTSEDDEWKEPSDLYKKTAKLLLDIQKKQKDESIKYIYLIRYESGKFVFILDPDPEEPAYYGKEVVYTASQDIAWAGTSAVDSESYEDEWGKYYTAWSPVKDSSDQVVAIVGVDFDSVWFSKQIHNNTPIIIVCSFVLLAVGISVTLAFTANMRKRFIKLNEEMTALSDDLETIFDEIDGIERTSEENPADYDGLDFMTYLNKKTADMKQRLKDHMEYMQQQANTDYLTKVGNVRAYFEHKDLIKKEIADGTADFALAMFDINGLKLANDTLGHECGNFLIRSTANIIQKVFSDNKVYRVGGDEFIVIISGVKDRDICKMFGFVDKELENLNAENNKFNITLSVSKGYAVFMKDKDTTYKDVFNRADQHMYQDKEEFYRRNGLKH